MRQRKDATRRTASGERSSSGYSKGQAKRQEILAGLMAALASGELRNPSLKAVGQMLGLEPAHILYYFGSREALVQEVIRHWDEGYAAIRKDKGGDLTLDEFVKVIEGNVTKPGVVHLYLSFAAEAVDALHPAHDFVQKRFERVKASLESAIRKEQADGTIKADVDADIEARLLIALADGLQLQSLIDPHVDAVRHIEAAVRRLRN